MKTVWYPVVPLLNSSRCGRLTMTFQPIAADKRRSTRVPLQVTVEAIGVSTPLACQGETIVVNMHRASIVTDAALGSGMLIEVQVYLTGKRARARVVFIDPDDCYGSGIELEKPQNIWGISLPPEDWSGVEHA